MNEKKERMIDKLSVFELKDGDVYLNGTHIKAVSEFRLEEDRDGRPFSELSLTVLVNRNYEITTDEHLPVEYSKPLRRELETEN